MRSPQEGVQLSLGSRCCGAHQHIPGECKHRTPYLYRDGRFQSVYIRLEESHCRLITAHQLTLYPNSPLIQRPALLDAIRDNLDHSLCTRGEGIYTFEYRVVWDAQGQLGPNGDTAAND